MSTFISTSLLGESEERFNTWNENKTLKSSSASAEAVTRKASRALSKTEIDKRKAAISKMSSEPNTEFALERVIGENDSVYSNYVEILAEVKRKVCRIVMKKDGRINGYATGFLVSSRLLLTNWHVFNSADDARQSELQFEYEYDFAGSIKTPVSFGLKPELFFRSVQKLDYCLLAVDSTDKTGKVPLDDFGYLYLDPTIGKAMELEYLSVIHHPNGDYKQISLRENKLVKKLEQFLWYETDTAQGSSGSPVLNDQFQVVALHHSGVPVKEKGGYLSRDGKTIIKPDAEGKVDASLIKWQANEGVRISVIIDDLLKSEWKDHALLKNMLEEPAGKFHVVRKEKSKAGTAVTAPFYQAMPEGGTTSATDEVKLTIPSHLLKSHGEISIRLGSNNSAQIQQAPALPPASADAFEENARPDSNYDQRKGYLQNFLSVAVPLPSPSATLLRKTSKIIGKPKEHELRYFHFSTLQHAVRKIPLLTAVNINGALDQNIPRKEHKNDGDKWYLDPRIPEEEQAGEWFYKSSGFDRGHMVRREDPAWGKTRDEALLANNDTFHFSNCAPQHPKLNREIWGALEDYILNAEEGKMRDMKMSVFTGPIFRENDPVMKGLQVPLSFYKIVTWVRGNKQLAATGFILDQIQLTKGMKGLAYEEFSFDQEPKFAVYQRSILEIAKLTDINFGVLSSKDTFKAKGKKTGKATKAGALSSLEAMVL